MILFFSLDFVVSLTAVWLENEGDSVFTVQCPTCVGKHGIEDRECGSVRSGAWHAAGSKIFNDIHSSNFPWDRQLPYGD